MAELDPLIHAPTRLQVLSTLSAVSEAEFATLRAALEVSDSVLSKHISTLADAGYVRSRKGVRAGRRTTWIGLTSAGRKALREHVAALRRLIDVRRLTPTSPCRHTGRVRPGRDPRAADLRLTAADAPVISLRSRTLDSTTAAGTLGRG